VIDLFLLCSHEILEILCCLLAAFREAPELLALREFASFGLLLFAPAFRVTSFLRITFAAIFLVLFFVASIVCHVSSDTAVEAASFAAVLCAGFWRDPSRGIGGDTVVVDLHGRVVCPIWWRLSLLGAGSC